VSARPSAHRRAVGRELRSVVPVELRSDRLRILDQRGLPGRVEWVEARSVGETATAMRNLAVRGAPLLGVTAGFAMALAARTSKARTPQALLADLQRAGRTLVASRPTAVNLGWAVDRVLRAARLAGTDVAQGRDRVEEEAWAIAREDEAACVAIAAFGTRLVPKRAVVINVLTHCNAGALATWGIGTALGVIARVHANGTPVHVWVGETRPVLQGARLTAWELRRLHIPMTLVADAAAGSLMARGEVDLVIVGADRIAANGDTANKVGTYQLAVLAHHHAVPFYVAAPVSTVDPATASGSGIVVEERRADEVSAPLGLRFAPRGTPVANPAFDVTPGGLITAIVTDRGIARPPYGRSLRRLMAEAAA
jgi:methylthioribose-1-phosphate isomerase